MDKMMLIAAAAVAACMACKGKSEAPVVEEPPPWEFPGEEVAPEDIPENVEVVMNQPTIEGTLTDEAARSALRPQIEDLVRCYEVRLARHCKIKGHMRISIDVSQKGQILGMQVLSDTTRDTRLGDCVSKVIRKASFGETDEQSTIIVNYAFDPPEKIRCE
ncbi:MAG: AgmX/PglI C-terminal domain-containing protein [Deltaproteobacteria bacterium]|nr:AgmX/PglI C-terminal domain-containing protein [Deltaproteobacteria bacterium]